MGHSASDIYVNNYPSQEIVRNDARKTLTIKGDDKGNELRLEPADIDGFDVLDLKLGLDFNGQSTTRFEKWADHVAINTGLEAGSTEKAPEIVVDLGASMKEMTFDEFRMAIEAGFIQKRIGGGYAVGEREITGAKRRLDDSLDIIGKGSFRLTYSALYNDGRPIYTPAVRQVQGEQVSKLDLPDHYGKHTVTFDTDGQLGFKITDHKHERRLDLPANIRLKVFDDAVRMTNLEQGREFGLMMPSLELDTLTDVALTKEEQDLERLMQEGPEQKYSGSYMTGLYEVTIEGERKILRPVVNQEIKKALTKITRRQYIQENSRRYLKKNTALKIKGGNEGDLVMLQGAEFLPKYFSSVDIDLGGTKEVKEARDKAYVVLSELDTNIDFGGVSVTGHADSVEVSGYTRKSGEAAKLSVTYSQYCQILIKPQDHKGSLYDLRGDEIIKNEENWEGVTELQLKPEGAKPGVRQRVELEVHADGSYKVLGQSSSDFRTR